MTCRDHRSSKTVENYVWGSHLAFYTMLPIYIPMHGLEPRLSRTRSLWCLVDDLSSRAPIAWNLVDCRCQYHLYLTIISHLAFLIFLDRYVSCWSHADVLGQLTCISGFRKQPSLSLPLPPQWITLKKGCVTVRLFSHVSRHLFNTYIPTVRLGNSGLKVSRFILGTMQFGSKEWQPWLIEEDAAISHIKAAYGVLCVSVSD